MIRKLKLFSITLLFPLLSSCYLINQGFNLLKYNISAIPLDEVYNNPNIKKEIKERIKLIYEIREFAINHLGLKKNKTYTRYVELNDRNYLVNVLVASKKDKLEAYKWTFPFFGSFPYKGFYDIEEAKKEEEILKKQGYDTYIRKAGAFSTLGWFDDPIYSYMLNYSTEYLANLIIHEMTHATIFIKDNIQFNEELASFIGDHGAVEFLKYKYGEDSNEYKNSFYIKEDNALFSKYINDFYNELDKNFRDESINIKQKLRNKKLIIDKKLEEFKELQKKFKIRDSYSWFPKLKINNAVIISFITYEKDSSLFDTLHNKLGNDLLKTINFLKYLDKNIKNGHKDYIKKFINDDEKVKKFLEEIETKK
ncbi:MAG: aminopeptidase [Candidatus Sericytochromatia bacterium]|nr:MAG: aminopeptidase [Candidatus Sericytochromatia bacterium]